MMKKNYQQLCSALLYVFFAIYVVILLYFLFFSRIGLRGVELFTINLIPFSTIAEQIPQLATNFRSMAFMNLVVNIFLLAPLGLYLPILLRKKKIIIYLCVIFIISFLVEIIQFVFDLGAADIDDIILNSFGGFLGLMSYRFLLAILKKECKVKVFTAIISAIVGILIIIFLAVQLYWWIEWNNTLI